MIGIEEDVTLGGMENEDDVTIGGMGNAEDVTNSGMGNEDWVSMSVAENGVVTIGGAENVEAGREEWRRLTVDPRTSPAAMAKRRALGVVV